MTIRFCKMCGGWHDPERWPPACVKIEPDKRGPYRVHVISDEMPAVQGQHDGRIYTSKSKIRASYRAHGVVEVGNDPARLRRTAAPKVDRNAIRASLERAKSRVALMS